MVWSKNVDFVQELWPLDVTVAFGLDLHHPKSPIPQKAGERPVPTSELPHSFAACAARQCGICQIRDRWGWDLHIFFGVIRPCHSLRP